MNKVTFPLKSQMQGREVNDLQAALQLLLDRAVILADNEGARRELSAALQRENTEQMFGEVTRKLVSILQEEQSLEGGGEVDESTAKALNRLLDEMSGQGGEQPEFVVKGTVRLSDDSPAAGVKVSAFDRDLRSEQELGQTATDRQGFYEIQYSARQFLNAERGRADLVVKAFAADGSLLAASQVLFNAPLIAEVDLTIPAEVLQPPTLFKKIGRALAPLIGELKVEELEEDKEHQDLTFLSGETGIEKPTLARFVLAHRLARQGIQAEFWFVLLGGSFYQFAENQSLDEQLTVVLGVLPSLDAAAVRKALTRGFNQKEISESFRENVADWIGAFLNLIASRTVSGSGQRTFVKLALDDAGIADSEQQEKFARLFNEQKALTPELLKKLGKDKSFKKGEIADLRTSFQLAELTQGDFSVVKAIKETFGVREPEKIRTLAKKSEKEWVKLVKTKHAAGELKLPIEPVAIAGQVKLPAVEVYGKMLERQFREAFPTTAFAGGLERALQNGGARGLRQPEVLKRFLDRHESFEFLNTPVDAFLRDKVGEDFRGLAKDKSFKTELKAIQRVFKLAPNFAATDALRADDLHSAQKVYRMGKTEFVRQYGKSPGFTPETALLAWNRAADTHAAVLTIIGDLNEFDAGILPGVLKSSSPALKNFPNWNNLFQAGDLCECEHCRSLLGPAEYFADQLMFLRDRKSTKPKSGGGFYSVKDILFARRPDLGYLELNCANALTRFPYVDAVCEVLEAAVDDVGENDLELVGFTKAQIPSGATAAKTAVKAAFQSAFADQANNGKEQIKLGPDFSLTAVPPPPNNADSWVVHGDDVTYLLKERAPSGNLFAKILPNTKASAAELRAYPQYVNPKPYKKLREAKYPMALPLDLFPEGDARRLEQRARSFALPFDLFAEELRAGFQKCNLQRWDLMRTLRGTAAPNNPTDGEIAAEYFGISIDATAAFDEKRLILAADPTVPGQKAVWGETGASWLNQIGNVKNFLQKTGLEYNELLALLDLKFINPFPARDIGIQHLDPSCDLEQKVIQVIDETKLDRIHRFLRMWRKLKDWKMWELDLVIRHPLIGNDSLDETFLVNLFYFSRLRNRLGGKTTVEQVSALFGNLNTETRFTKLHENREDALYKNLFLNRRLIKPLDPAFEVVKVNVSGPTTEQISTHHPVVLAVLGIRESDLVLFKELTKPSDGTHYITDDLTLSNLSFLWRHGWLSKLLKFKAEEWKTILKIFQQDILNFATPKAAWEFVERVDQLKPAGFTPDELNWLLSADRSAKAATKETDAARFLTALRKDLKAIQAEYDQRQYAFLTATPPTDVERITALLTSLLQKLNRDDAATQFFIATLTDEVGQQKKVTDIPAIFGDFPAPIKSAIPISYDRQNSTLRFTGLMTAAQYARLRTDALLASVTGVRGYQEAIAEFFNRPRFALKFFEPVFSAPLASLPAGVDFKNLAEPALILKVSYDAEQRVLRVAGILSEDEKAALDALSADVSYRNAVNSVFTQPAMSGFPPEKIWLQDTDLLFPLRDLANPTNDNLAANLAIATAKALAYLSRTLSENAVVQQSSAQLGLTEALTRRLLTQYTFPALHFDGIMSTPQRTVLLNNSSLSQAIRDLASYKQAIEQLFQGAGQAWVSGLRAGFGFPPSITGGSNPIPIRYEPIALLTHLTGAFAATPGVVDYATGKTTFDGWYWANRAAVILKKWKVTLAEFEKIVALTNRGQLLDFLTLPLDDTGAIASLERFLRTSRLLRLRDSLPETEITLLEVLEKLNTGAYATYATVAWPTFTPVAGAYPSFPKAITISTATAGAQMRYTTNGSDPSSTNGTLIAGTSGIANVSAGQTLKAIAFKSGVTDSPIASGLYTQQAVTAAANPPTMEQHFFAADVERLNDAWPAVDLEALIVSLDLTYRADYLLVENWERLRRAFYFIDNLNAHADMVKRFAAAAMTDFETQTLKELLRSKFGQETWLALSAEIQDALRERKRDALAAYLLTHLQPANPPTLKWENTNDLYAYYLLDVEMCSCQLTSRHVQGSGSIQLLVQRCFMGLEPEVEVKADGDEGDSAWRWWKWMRKYRVWEANRKVFLWPENWIEPELKKDRSSFQKDLENELLQNEINQYTVETAFTNYLEKLDHVAQLEIAGFYQEDDGDNTIIHVFGRTPGAEPHLYYYRHYDYRQWTPWEKVDLDIQGDYLIPAVVSKRLFLFWPVFTEVPDEAGNTAAMSIPTPGSSTYIPKKAQKKLRLQMAVSDYRQGRWTPKRVSKDFAQSGAYDIEIIRKNYRFFPIDRSEVDGRFGISYIGHSVDSSEQPQANLSGAFEISDCKGVPSLSDYSFDIPDQAIRPESASSGDDTAFLKWVELSSRNDDENDFTLENYFSYQSDNTLYTPVLIQTPWIFKMSPAWHLSYLDRLWLDLPTRAFLPRARLPLPSGIGLPFFYNDKKRTFFVLPSIELPWTEGREVATSINYRAKPSGSAQISSDVRSYYPEIKKFVRHWEVYFDGQVQTGLDGFDLSTLTSVERQKLYGLWEGFCEEAPPSLLGGAPPPYAAEEVQQVKNFIKRCFMWFFKGLLGAWSLSLFRSTQFHFKNFYHPFVCDFAKLVYNPLKGISTLMSRETQLKDSGFSFEQVYQPTDAVVKLPPEYPSVQNCYPGEVVDFTPNGAYSPYNWEIFFHVPLFIANSLSRNQRFEEARDWYHFIFNPIGVESAGGGSPSMSKYWITKPFFQTTDPQYVQERIDNILGMLAGDTSLPGYSAQTKKDLEDQVFDWRTNPFEPHRIANYRTVAYQKTVVMKYLDNLIAWGDNLFQQDSMESINEATQLYVMAAEILGARPKKIPPQAKPPLESFNELEDEFDKFSNALVNVENLIPLLPGNGPDGADPSPLPMLYFCIPQNDKMLSYWDTVADRLYKIRHCMNIEGVVRQLALFEPPIDPAALVKAVAAGVDISSALADLNAPLPLYRFNILLQKANEVCNDLKALGGALVTALNEENAEGLNMLRQNQEIKLLEAVKAVREKQIEEAKENLEGIKKSKALVETRRNYYRDIEQLSTQEKLHLDKLGESHTLQEAAQGVKLAASIISILPAIDLGASGFGGSPIAKFKIGGLELGQAANLASDVLSFLSQIAANDASMASSKGSFDRRWHDWKLQERVDDKELDQMDKQIAAAELRIAITEKELENHVLQIENAKETDAFMRSKYTNQELRQWQVGQISGVYFPSYRLAYDLAKRAERCFRFELGLQDSSYISFGYWDSLKKGLLSGEKLQYDLRRLETAYLEQNRREFELTKHASVALLDPLALVKLRETGRCFINLPEEIFDLDYPGHYFRRIKSVSVTLPCVTGPYTTISCTLRLLKNSIRINTANGDNGYPHNTDDQGLSSDDDRFVENNIPVKAVAASNAQNDSGVFELSFRDERYLPFEGAGALSEWSLELFSDLPSNNPHPAKPDFGKPLRQFDYKTISDAILHIRYTAREDAGPFKNGAITHLREHFSQHGATPSLRMFSLRQEFPTQWYRFLNPTSAGNVFELEVSPGLFPFRDEKKTLKLNSICLFARGKDGENYTAVLTRPLPKVPPSSAPPPPVSDTFNLVQVNQYGGLHFAQKDVSTASSNPTINLAVAPVKWKLTIQNVTGTPRNLENDPAEVEDVFLVLGYEWE